MDLATLYFLAQTSHTYNEFKEEVDYQITGHLKTTVSSNEFALIQIFNQLKDK